MPAHEGPGFTVKLSSHRQDRAVIVDDDGRTGYGYVTNSQELIADVWLYNRLSAPEEPEWHFRPPDPPFLNPRHFCMDNAPFSLPVTDKVLQIQSFDHRQDFGAFIFLHGCIAGLVIENRKPGWATMAKTSGPLARSFQKLLPKARMPAEAVWPYLIGAARAAHGLSEGMSSSEGLSNIELAWVADLIEACCD